MPCTYVTNADDRYGMKMDEKNIASGARNMEKFICTWVEH